MNENDGEYRQGYYFSKIINVLGHRSTEHYHDAFEIYYMKEGTCDYFIGNRSFKVSSGDIMLIPEGTIHRTIYGDKPHSRYLINFDKKYVSDELYKQLCCMDFLYRNKDVTEPLECILQKLENEYSLHDSLTEVMLKAYTYELLCLILRNKNELCEEKENRLISASIEYLNDNYMNDVTLASVAGELSVSFEHLSRLFKRETGFGFNEYLTLLRLRRAEYMLKNEPGLKISEVAYSVGFNDSNYFSYKFKAAFGCSPGAVKRKVKNEV